MLTWQRAAANKQFTMPSRLGNSVSDTATRKRHSIGPKRQARCRSLCAQPAAADEWRAEAQQAVAKLDADDREVIEKLLR
jgi:hypothetical protein